MYQGGRADTAGHPLTDNSLEAITAAIQTLVYGERLPMAARWCDMLLAEAEARGVIWWQAVFSGCRAEIAIRNGELVDAERHAVRALDLIGPHGWGSRSVCRSGPSSTRPPPWGTSRAPAST